MFGFKNGMTSHFRISCKEIEMNKHLLLLGFLITMLLVLCMGCSATSATADQNAVAVGKLNYESSMDVEYASNFRVDYYDGGYALISILSNNTKFLVVPEHSKVPEGLDEDIAIIRQPVSNIYLVSTSAMCFFDQLDAIDVIRLSGTKPEGWYVNAAARAMEEGKIIFAGKYNQPDYEMIRAENSVLSIQSGMIGHAPEVKEKLEELGVNVLVDQSSYESHPLGRTEWIKVYSVLLDKEELAAELFQEQAEVVEELADIEPTGQSVAYFYINLSGKVSVRNSNDYVPKMVRMAGGQYIFENLGDPSKAISTTLMGMEEFYATAKNADFIFYNTTIAGEVESMEQLLEKNELLQNFKAVKEKNVWCTHQNLLQHPDQMGTMIEEMHKILTMDREKLEDLEYFYKLD